MNNTQRWYSDWHAREREAKALEAANQWAVHLAMKQREDRHNRRVKLAWNIANTLIWGGLFYFWVLRGIFRVNL